MNSKMAELDHQHSDDPQKLKIGSSVRLSVCLSVKVCVMLIILSTLKLKKLLRLGDGSQFPIRDLRTVPNGGKLRIAFP